MISEAKRLVSCLTDCSMHSSKLKYWNIVVHVVVIRVNKKTKQKQTPSLSKHVFVGQFGKK